MISTEFSKQYQVALDLYLSDPTGSAIDKAYVLGREAVSKHVDLLDMIAIHHEALVDILIRSQAPPDSTDMVRRAANFLTESLPAFEMLIRGFQESITALSQLNKTLEDRVTERTRSLQEANQRLIEANRYKDQFLSIISHELRTPLNFITGFSSLLSDEVAGPLNEEQQSFVSKIMLGADQMLHLVNNLLDMSRIQAGKFNVMPSETSFEELLEEAINTWQPVATQKHVTFRSECDVHLPVMVDAERIRQVLNNFLDNALKFTPEGGSITIRSFIRDSHLLTQISDTGAGIAPEDIPKLFIPFSQLDMSSTRKVGGTGLGLSICKAIIEAHCGDIGVLSEMGCGSTFWFSVPVFGCEYPKEGSPSVRWS